MNTHISVAWQFLGVAVRRRKGWQKTKILAVQWHNDVDAQFFRPFHEFGVAVLRIHVVKSHCVGTQVGYSFKISAPGLLVHIRLDVLRVGPSTSNWIARDAGVFPLRMTFQIRWCNGGTERVIVFLISWIVGYALGKESLACDRVVQQVAPGDNRVDRFHTSGLGSGRVLWQWWHCWACVLRPGYRCCFSLGILDIIIIVVRVLL
mmetsp:Transcript_97/g.182  ORF Transcript_97/g.182 Transcript_97/m.182 type:complete len:205 (+) Transcript_97:1076-1690(+)